VCSAVKQRQNCFKENKRLPAVGKMLALECSLTFAALKANVSDCFSALAAADGEQ
jgi:hypothetical protein